MSDVVVLTGPKARGEWARCRAGRGDRRSTPRRRTSVRRLAGLLISCIGMVAAWLARCCGKTAAWVGCITGGLTVADSGRAMDELLAAFILWVPLMLINYNLSRIADALEKKDDE